MAFGNTDAIDQRNHDRLRELEGALIELMIKFEQSTSLSQNEKAQAIQDARSVLRFPIPGVNPGQKMFPILSGSFC